MTTITTLPNKPTNVIFTGVAGTGKTHRLLQIQQLYDEVIDSSWEAWRVQQLHHYSWREAVCAVLLLEDRMMSVPEMMRHPVIKDKMAANDRLDNVNQTLWVQLNLHAHPESTTVNTSRRSANYYFDKTESSQWFLLDEVKEGLAKQLVELLSLYDGTAQSQTSSQHTIKRSCLVSFHQSYGYDEFVEGIRPRVNAQTGQMQYDIQLGAFLTLCQQAAADPTHRYAMLIDEINRANTAQVFGELMSVIEPSKRMGASTPMSVRLAYSGRQFSVPSNVDIYATMNTQDYSLASLDMAFRRRFEFVACLPDSSVVGKVRDADGQEVDLAYLMEAINHRLLHILGEDAQLGQAYFLDIKDISQLSGRLVRQVIPQIEQQLRVAVSSHQVSEQLMQVLYGSRADTIPKHCVLQLAMLNDDGVTASKRSFSPQIRLSPALLAAANGSPVTGDEPQSSIFLTAMPYRQLYEDYANESSAQTLPQSSTQLSSQSLSQPRHDLP